MCFGVAEVLALAIALAAAGLARMEPARARDYIHVLTHRHAVLIADGVQAESLLLGPMAEQALTEEPGMEVDAALLRGLAVHFPTSARRAALPLVTRREAALLLEQGARPLRHARAMAKAA